MSEMRTDLLIRDLVREIEAGIGRRIDALERENARLKRRWRLLLGSVALSSLAALNLFLHESQKTPSTEIVEASQFVVRDADGFVRAVLGANADGSAGLTLQDRAAEERLRLVLLADGSPGISFADPLGRTRAVLGLLPDQTASLVFADREGRGRTVLGLSTDESSTLVFVDRDGYTRAGMGVNRAGLAELIVSEAPEEADVE